MKSAFGRVARGNYYSRVLLFIAVATAAPLIALLFYPEESGSAPAFIIPAAAVALLGLLLPALFREKPQNEQPRVWSSPLKDGSLPVLFAWCASIVAGAAPFYLAGLLSPIHALFESASGWTTGGISVIDLRSLPRIFLLHRALTQFCGGLGFVIIIAVVLQGRQMASLYNAEGHPDGFMPNLRRTAATISLIYTACLILGTLLYRIFGMTFFDGLCHAMSAISTAGFSTRAGSIEEFASVPIELVTIFLMLVGASNFGWLLLLVRRRFRRLAKISELRFMLVVIAVFTALMTLSLVTQHGKGFWDGLHSAAFCVVSILSTTGYASESYALWPAASRLLIILLMTIGAATGSTGGGIKLLRVYVLARAAKSNILRRISPSHSVKLMRYTRLQGEAPIDDALVRDTLEHIFIYILVLFAGAWLITLFEGGLVTPGDALFEFNAALGTSGVSNGLAERASNGTLIVQMLGMLLGRLEIFIFFLGLHSAFDKARRALPFGRLFKK